MSGDMPTAPTCGVCQTALATGEGTPGAIRQLFPGEFSAFGVDVPITLCKRCAKQIECPDCHGTFPRDEMIAVVTPRNFDTVPLLCRKCTDAEHARHRGGVNEMGRPRAPFIPFACHCGQIVPMNETVRVATGETALSAPRGKDGIREPIPLLKAMCQACAVHEQAERGDAATVHGPVPTADHPGDWVRRHG